MRRERWKQIAPAMALFAAMAVGQSPDKPDRHLFVPDGYDHWYLAKTPNVAGGIYGFRYDGETRRYVNEHEKSGDLIRYDKGAMAFHLKDETLYSFVRTEDGAEGWISSELLEPSAEEKKAAEVARKAAADAEAKAEKERIRKEVQRMEFCSALFKATADKRVGDLTVRESQNIRACQSAGLYHQ